MAVRDSGTGDIVERYAYDADGRLAATYDANGLTQRFAWDGAQMVGARDGNGVAKWDAVWGTLDQLLSWRDLAAHPVGDVAVLPITDHRGSIVGGVESDAGGTTLLAAADCTPMGRVVTLDPTDDDAETCREQGNPGTRCAHPGGMPFGFAGAWRSEATGLVYMRFRWYSPTLAQFLTPDPMGEVDSWNLYAYVGGDPINRWDPWGLESTQTAKKPPCGEACQVAPAGGGVLIRWNRTFGRIRAGWGKPGRRGSASSDRTPEQEAAENRLEEQTREQARRNEYRIRETENREPRVGARVRRNLGREGESEYPPTARGPQLSRPWLDVEIERAREEVAREAPPGPPAPGAAPPVRGAGESSSAALGQALEAAGQVRPPGTAAHHIVAGNAPAAARARAVLERFGIGINEAVNGVFLPGTRAAPNATGAAVHSTVHTNSYYQTVNQVLGAATTRAEAEAALGSIRNELLSGGL